MHFIQADAARLPFADKAFDLVFTSPPYADARTYGIGAQRDCQKWIDWMIGVVSECVRVCKGLVLVNCAGVTGDWCYWPACEGLLYEWWKRGGRCWRPSFWHRVGIPGSGGKCWLRADVEYVLCFTGCYGELPWSDNTADGHIPKYAAGGAMSSRLSDGTMVNEWGGGKSTFRMPDGSLQKQSAKLSQPVKKAFTARKQSNKSDERKEEIYDPPAIANPGNIVFGIPVGGGMMGNDKAHENEAPFPQKLAEWFIRGWCPPAGRVLDCFSGSGTTVAAATSLGRKGVGCDLRFSQCELGRSRCSEVQTLLF